MASPQHPFDSAYSLMKSLQAQLVELRGVVQAEQAQRHQETSQLKNEVADLRDQLHRLQGDHGAFYERVTCAMTSETALRGRAVEKLRDELNEVLAQSVEVRGLKDQMATQFSKLNFELRLEKQERQTGQDDLNSKLTTEIADRVYVAETIETNLATLTKQTQSNTALDREIMTSVAQSVQMAGHLLFGAGVDTARAAQLMAIKAQAGGSGFLSKPGTAGTQFSGCSTAASPNTTASQAGLEGAASMNTTAGSHVTWEGASPKSDTWKAAEAAVGA
eukprot:TRINITY_DN62937_c0_g1_i1.p1 TRINITY_DN62937_c0_g1~~TRINITY_DN62937_c0_g1_i1.p1  ORF type:complete len:317 (+),score=62.10 TRINITY_DN62937_c0_g1_i1:126-953(+)